MEVSTRPGRLKPADLEVGAAAAIALPGIIEAAAGKAGEAQARPADVEDLQRHRLQLRMHFGTRAAAAGQCAAAAGEGEIGRRERPAVAALGQHGRLAERQRPALDAALAGEPDGVRRDVGQGRELERRAAAPGDGGADLAAAVDELGVGGEPREAHAAHFQPARIDHAVERRSSLGEDDAAVEPAAAHRKRAGEAHAARPQMRVDPLRFADRRKAEAAVEPAAGDRQGAR